MKRVFAKFSIFEQGNPYHQSTYRFPPLHQTGVAPWPERVAWITSLWERGSWHRVLQGSFDTAGP